jgi:hypothetical protein
MIEQEALCQRIPGTIYLQRRMSVVDLEELAACEHFDVVLALSVLHTFEDGPRALRAVLGLGDHTIIETPPPSDTVSWHAKHLSGPAIWAALPEARTELCRTGSNTTPTTYRPVLLFETPKRTIEKHYLYSPKGTRATMGEVTIESSFDEKIFCLDRDFEPAKHERRPWIHGINLQTYLTLHGVWPHPLTVGEWVNAAPLRSTNHGDLMPYNFILGRDRVDAIDFDDYQLRPDADGLECTISVLQARA